MLELYMYVCAEYDLLMILLLIIIMLCLYMGDATTMMDILGGGNRVVKEF